MKTMKLSLSENGKRLPERESERILRILWDHLNETEPKCQNEPDNIGLDITQLCIIYLTVNPMEEILGVTLEHKIKRMIRRLALHAYGSTSKKAQDRVAGLTLVGDGECPQCGSNEVVGGYNFRRCSKCGLNWYNEDKDELVFAMRNINQN